MPALFFRHPPSVVARPNDAAAFCRPPTFTTLLRFGSADLISFYQNATALADAFSRVYGENYHQKLVQAL